MPPTKRKLETNSHKGTPSKKKTKVVTDVYNEAMERLSANYSLLDGAFPHRDPHLAQIKQHLKSAIQDGTGCCIYISGVPGTCKTSTTREVLRQLKCDTEEPLKFRDCEINGMTLADPGMAYTLLWKCLAGDFQNKRKVSANQAQHLLDDYYHHTGGSGIKSTDLSPVVVVMDEMDQLITKKQDLIYNFFNWPNLPVKSKNRQHAPLIVLAIANTMDLPERTLTNKNNSRLGLRRVEFMAYTYEQIEQICHDRVGNLLLNQKGKTDVKLFESNAITLCARRVASVSGDARRALEICRRCVDAARSNESAVTVQLVNAIYASMYSTPTSIFLKQAASLHQKITLCAILYLISQYGVSDVAMGQLFKKAVGLCRSHNVSPPSYSSFVSVVSSLGQLRILIVQSKNQHGFNDDLSLQICLNVPEEDVKEAIQSDETVKSFLKK
ncbi:hypothetical protein MIR68_002035 [Amoeboaphelidium protococcarum]|nr:hypothetical protein MIR68_002035 [Amoeboaphelidium protococcarum]